MSYFVKDNYRVPLTATLIEGLSTWMATWPLDLPCTDVAALFACHHSSPQDRSRVVPRADTNREIMMENYHY